MARRKRFNPIKYYGGGGSAVRKPLTVKAPTRQKYTQPKGVPLSTAGHLFDKAAPVIAGIINANREEKDRENMQKALLAYRSGLPGERERIDLSEQEIMDQYARPAYDAVIGGPMDIDETGEDIDRRADDAWYNALPDTDGKGNRFIEGPRLEGLDAAVKAAGDKPGPVTQKMLHALLLSDIDRKQAKADLAAERAYKKEVAKTLAQSKIEAAQAKPPADPTSYKEWKLSKSDLPYDKWMEKRDYAKMGLGPPGGSGEQPTVISGGPADIKQQRVKLTETSNALLRRRVELMEQKNDPEYIKKIEEIRKSEGYLIDLKRSRPKAEGALKTLEMKSVQVQSIIKDALPLAKSMWSAGFGTAFKAIPESSSRKLAGLLTNLRAIIGFDTLAEMRANSPTGGALGQVSNIEINLLQAVQGTLDQGQREILVRSLEHIYKNYPQLVELGRTRFKKQYAPLEAQPGSSPRVIRFDVNGNIIQ